MTTTRKAEAACLCGAIQLIAHEMNPRLGACHCEMCRKWTGGPLMTVQCGSKVNLVGEEYLGVFDSSPWAERGFCKKCGSGVFYRLKESQDHFIPIGLFKNPGEITFDIQVFIDKKPNYYCFSNQTKTMTEEEVFAMYGAASDKKETRTHD